ncbi:shikimate kinase [Nocardia brasiliensis NBRC 14402]|nr:shikimate kinase [Nocardia brasiliensis NBRC 14402]SUB48441.1 Shikimate kinase [Nocardia brasiliensis]
MIVQTDPRAPRVVLVGPPGAGKSTIGRKLAKELGVELYDTDAGIERETGRTIPEIFATDGEPEFRRIEERVVRRAILAERGVVSLGGGAVLSKDTRALLRNRTVVYLEISVGEGLRRTGASTSRPLLNGADPAAKYRELMRKRRPLYREVATVRVRTDGRSPGRVVKMVLAKLGLEPVHPDTGTECDPTTPPLIQNAPDTAKPQGSSRSRARRRARARAAARRAAGLTQPETTDTPSVPTGKSGTTSSARSWRSRRATSSKKTTPEQIPLPDHPTDTAPTKPEGPLTRRWRARRPAGPPTASTSAVEPSGTGGADGTVGASSAGSTRDSGSASNTTGAGNTTISSSTANSSNAGGTASADGRAGAVGPSGAGGATGPTGTNSATGGGSATGGSTGAHHMTRAGNATHVSDAAVAGDAIATGNAGESNEQSGAAEESGAGGSSGRARRARARRARVRARKQQEATTESEQ